MHIKKLSNTIIIVEKIYNMKLNIFKIVICEENKNSLNALINSISRWPAVKLLESLKAILIARISLPVNSIKGKNKLKIKGIVHVILLIIEKYPNMGINIKIKPKPTNITSANNNKVSHSVFSFIKGVIASNTFISEGNHNISIQIKPISWWPSSAATDFTQLLIKKIKLSMSSQIDVFNWNW